MQVFASGFGEPLLRVIAKLGGPGEGRAKTGLERALISIGRWPQWHWADRFASFNRDCGVDKNMPRRFDQTAVDVFLDPDEIERQTMKFRQ